MKEMSEECREKYLKEMSIRLGAEGYSTRRAKDGYLPVDWLGEELCLVTSGGGVRYREQDLERDGARKAFDRVVDMSAETAEYMILMESAPPLKASGLDDTYKALAEFNGAVLAAHPTSHGVQIITWEWDYYHTSMWQGHYFGGNYAKAKADFAIRANIIERDSLFSPEQQAELYRAVNETLDSGCPISDERRKLLESAAEQIERNVPDLQERMEMSAQLDQTEAERLSRGQTFL